MDANFVLTANDGVVDMQATAEIDPMIDAQIDALFALVRNGVAELCKAKNATLRGSSAMVNPRLTLR